MVLHLRTWARWLTYSGTGAGGRESRCGRSSSSFPMHQPVAPIHHLADEAGVLLKGVEVTAAPQHEGLVDGVLEPVVGLLGNAVLMGLSCIYQGGLEPIVVQKLGVAAVQGPAAAALHLVGGGRGVVRADHPRRTAQLPQGVL